MHLSVYCGSTPLWIRGIVTLFSRPPREGRRGAGGGRINIYKRTPVLFLFGPPRYMYNLYSVCACLSPSRLPPPSPSPGRVRKREKQRTRSDLPPSPFSRILCPFVSRLFLILFLSFSLSLFFFHPFPCSLPSTTTDPASPPFDVAEQSDPS